MVVQRLRLVVGLVALAELVIFLLVAAWIGLGWTILATLLTGALEDEIAYLCVSPWAASCVTVRGEPVWPLTP